jgi:mannosyltransferase OCH1-like enzyme
VNIPKVIHYIWLGQKPMHPLMIEWREGWRRLHPSWAIQMWTEGKSIDELVSGHLILRSQYAEKLQRCCHLSQRSNIWRYELLAQLGGLYLDADFEPLRSIDTLTNGMTSFAGQCLTNTTAGIINEIGCALIGCVPHHPWLEDLVTNIKTRDPTISTSLGVPYFTEITAQHTEVNLFPPDVFYSCRWDEPGKYKPAIPPIAHAVHRWSSKWFPQGFAKISHEM